MSSVKIDCAIPLGSDAGHVAIEIEIERVEALTNVDRNFLGSLIDKLTAWTGSVMLDIPLPAVPPNEVPEVLRGLVRGAS